MKIVADKRIFFRAGALALLYAGAVCGLFAAGPAQARMSEEQPPALVISNGPLPPDLQSKVYSKPSVAPQTSPYQVLGPDYYDNQGETIVGRKVDALRGELFNLQGTVAELSEQLAGLETRGQTDAAEYYASIATISTQLQSGTTPGNPRLVSKLNIARDNLERLSGNVADFNDLAVGISEGASMASYLLESARATYGLSGAVEEDHVRLAQLEDAVNNTVVVIERLLNNVNDDITRTTAYLATERDNLRTLSLAINTGDLFGKSLSNRPFASVGKASFVPVAASAYGAAIQPPPPLMPDAPPPFAPDADSYGSYPAPLPLEPAAYPAPESVIPPLYPAMPGGIPSSPRPLAKIRFDKPDVAYEQPIYMAINEALSRYPNARFELVAVHPDKGNAAKIAIESAKARRNAEKVLRSLTEMGLQMDRVDLSYAPSPDATTNEVHLYIR